MTNMIYGMCDITNTIRNDRNNYRIDEIRRKILTGEECQLCSCKTRCNSH